MVKKMPYRKMIINELSNFQKKVDNHGIFTSRQKIKAVILKKYKCKFSNGRINYLLKQAFQRLESDGMLIKRRNSYRLRLKFLKKHLKTIVKKKSVSVKKIVKSKAKKSLVKNKPLPLSKSSPVKVKPVKVKVPKLIKKAVKKQVSIVQPIVLPVVSPVPKSEKRYLAIWQYYDKNKGQNADGWYNYDVKASDIVEDHWQQYVQNRAMNDVRAVKSGEWEYMVDFMNWKQTNIQHQNHKERDIRRLDEKGNITVNPYI